MFRNILVALTLCWVLPACSQILGIEDIPESADEEMSLCGNGALDPGETCDDGNRVNGDGCSAECRPDVDAGMSVECSTGTCIAGACETARCEDGACVVESICGQDEECCGGACVAAGCDDGDPCTADSCGQLGCEHAPADGAACSDGNYCNGADICVNGACEEHEGDPCEAPTTCDESQSVCVGCLESSDCPEAEASEWSACDGFDGMCGLVGATSRTITVYTCQNNICVGETQTETDSCERDTEGLSCGGQSTTPWSTCEPVNGTCDHDGTQTRDVTVNVCRDGSCAAETSQETAACTRSPQGVTCAPNQNGAWSTCDGGNSTCNENGTQSRTVTTFACGASDESCVGSSESQTRSCSLDTDDTPCGGGSPTCDPWGGCSTSGTECGPGSRFRTCTQSVCASGDCDGTETFTQTQNCNVECPGDDVCQVWGACCDPSTTCIPQ